MDSLTHLLVGHAMGTAMSNTGPLGAAAYWGVLVGNSLPDIDVPISLIFRRDIKLHRTVTHTIPGALVLSAIAALMIHQFVPAADLLPALIWTFAGALVHMAMDCLNLFGAKPFWPLSSRSVDIGVLHIFDPVLAVLLGVPSLGVWLGWAQPALLGLAFWLMWPYIGYRLATARKLFYRMKSEGSIRARVVPWFTGWRYIYESTGGIELGRWNRGRRLTTEAFPNWDSPLIRQTLDNPDVSAFLATAAYPYAMVEKADGGHLVVWCDALCKFRADFQPIRIKVLA